MIEKKLPLVSIIIPVYNVKNYLIEALESIILQTYSKLEIIIVNDGSTDNSLEIVKNYEEKDSRIKVIDQENRGLSCARNSGLKIAWGKYVYFFDSDDILDISTIEKCVKRAEKDNLDLVLFDANSFEDETNKEISPLKYQLSNKVSESEIYSGKKFLILDNLLTPVWLKFIKLEVLRKNDLDFYPGIIHEDELFTPLLFSSCHKIGYINEVFFKRRVRKNSIMTVKKSEKNIIGYLTAIRELKKRDFDKEVEEEINLLIRKRSRLILSMSEELSCGKKYWKIIKNEFFEYLKMSDKFKVSTYHFHHLLKKIKERVRDDKKN